MPRPINRINDAKFFFSNKKQVIEYEKNISWLPLENKVYKTEFNYRLLPGGGNTRFHFSPTEGSDMFAEFVIKKLNLLKESNPQWKILISQIQTVTAIL